MTLLEKCEFIRHKTHKFYLEALQKVLKKINFSVQEKKFKKFFVDELMKIYPAS